MTTTRKRCTGSKLLLVDTAPSQSDPFHHYGATCPVCDRRFLLPQHDLPIHYVTTTSTPAAPAGWDETATGPTDAAPEAPLPIFEPGTHAVEVVVWNAARGLERCFLPSCSMGALFQVLRQDVYDGLWLQACPGHLVAATHQVAALQPGAAPHGPREVYTPQVAAAVADMRAAFPQPEPLACVACGATDLSAVVVSPSDDSQSLCFPCDAQQGHPFAADQAARLAAEQLCANCSQWHAAGPCNRADCPHLDVTRPTTDQPCTCRSCGSTFGQA